MDLVADLYSITDCFPSKETFSLTDQMRGGAVSVPGNIAEGQAHFSKLEFRHFFATRVVPWRSLKLRF